MACEGEKCEKYGLHHDFQDGVEIRKCFACQRDDSGWISVDDELPPHDGTYEITNRAAENRNKELA